MKRDMDLIKAILLDLEEHCDGTFCYRPAIQTIPYQYGGTDAEFEEHCRLIAEKGLAIAHPSLNAGTSFSALT